MGIITALLVNNMIMSTLYCIFNEENVIEQKGRRKRTGRFHDVAIGNIINNFRNEHASDIEHETNRKTRDTNGNKEQ